MPGDPATPLIRPARASDADAVAALTAEALAAKYRPAFGRHAERGIAALLLSDVDGGGGSHHWVAEVDGRVAGAVHLVVDEDGGLDPLRAVWSAVGPWRSLRAVLVLSLLAPGRLQPGEAYIDELAVADWARRRGVARALLRRCEEEAVAEGRTRLTLWVTLDNAPALRLYAAAGFRERRRRRWITGRLVFGSPGAAFMARELPRRP